MSYDKVYLTLNVQKTVTYFGPFFCYYFLSTYINICLYLIILLPVCLDIVFRFWTKRIMYFLMNSNQFMFIVFLLKVLFFIVSVALMLTIANLHLYYYYWEIYSNMLYVCDPYWMIFIRYLCYLYSIA